MEAGNDDMSGDENGSGEEYDGDYLSESEDEYPTDTAT